MPLAAPLILPFAELAGITIAGLSMAAASQKVSDFISDNPELSKQILTTLLPGGVGLNTLFKKEAGITLEDVEEMTDEEAADLSKEDKAEIMKEVGKSKGGDKRQRMIEISEKLGLSGKGKEEQDFVDEVEERYEGTIREKKPTFDYKKFFRNRNADGGAIGIEVLFEEKKDGGRIGFANGGDNIIGSTIDKFFSGPSFEKYDAERQRAYTESPSRLDYNIDANKAAGQFIQDRTKELLGDNPVSNVIGQAGTYASVPVAFMASPFHEGAQVVAEGRMEPGSGVKGFTKAFLDEDPLITAAQRAGGVLQSTPLGETIYNIGGKAADLVSGIRNTNIGDFFFPSAAAADFQGGEMLQAPTSPVRADYERAPNTAFAELLAQAATTDDGFEEMLAEATRKGQRQSFLSQVADYLPFGPKSVTGNITRGIGSMFRNIAPATYGYSTDVFNRMTPGQQSYTSSLYSPGGLLEGYNQQSAFGVGALGTLSNRLSAIQNRKAPQTAASLARQQEIKDAINKTINIGEQEALSDPNRSITTPSGNRIRTDVEMSEGAESPGGGGKIVCTMMNESYGFGNFRNKIWLKHSRDLPKEYEIGYHAIFLPLVKFAKGEGKLNKVVKKTLEHIARHRTLDLKQEMKGKTHTLGRVYRKILEPICLMVGKIKKAVK